MKEQPRHIINRDRTVGFLRPNTCTSRYFTATPSSLDRLYRATATWRALIDHAGVTHLFTTKRKETRS